MGASIDKEAKRHVDQMHLLFEELEAQINSTRDQWQKRLVEDQERLLERRSKNADVLDKLDSAIQVECEECRKHAEAEQVPIWEKLRAHDASLLQQISERRQQHSDYAEALQEGFERLRRRIRAET